ncbi:tetratricopeptide repeat protein [Bartonella ancashensis]|uniref:Mlr7403-like protein n=1 Tax=Bartonella ancashensis TaxID=1318743 RepID=A0A0M5KSV2_9HYPH|nr:tetratricopeptide repeat protein [Bartonella ancashensis]ALE04090.1 Mlr7403-like protein [Bartonella ancashensis]
MLYDSFVREVNEELRQEKIYTFWKRYGVFIIVALVMFVLTIVAYQIFSHRKLNKENAISDAFMKSIELIEEHHFGEAMQQLENVKASNLGGYPFLARLREASLMSERGDDAQAVKLFDAVASHKKAPLLLQKVAKVRAAYILVDTGTLDDVEKRVKDMANDIDPMRMSAREALGLAAYKAAKMDEAAYYFQKNAEESLLGLGITDRAKVMLELIQATGKTNKR